MNEDTKKKTDEEIKGLKAFKESFEEKFEEASQEINVLRRKFEAVQQDLE